MKTIFKFFVFIIFIMLPVYAEPYEIINDMFSPIGGSAEGGGYEITKSNMQPYDSVFTGIPLNERDVLIDLYNSTDGENWDNNTNWLGASDTECTWYGVSCDAENKVVEINLNSNSLNGTIPASIGDLTNLQTLNLANNQLTEDIPSELGNLTTLKNLYLNGNTLKGNIPSEIINLVNLIEEGSDFSYNALYTSNTDTDTFMDSKQAGGDWKGTQTIRPSNLSVSETTANSVTLTWTSIFYTDETGGYEISYAETPDGAYSLFVTTADKMAESVTVTGLLPAKTYYFHLRTVTYPNTNNDNTVFSDYTEEISVTTKEGFPSNIPPAEKDSLVDLYNKTNGANWANNTSWLNDAVPECNWHGIICDTGNAHVEHILLKNNQLTGNIPALLENLTNLRFLYLDNNMLTDNIPEAIGNLSNIEFLSLDYNQLTGTIPPEFGNLTNLQHINLNSNQLKGSVPAEMANLTNLENGGSDFRWNAIHTSDSDLCTFLDSKQIGGDWESTQTVAPTNISFDTVTETSVNLSWTAIPYTDDTGGYEIYYSLESGGPYTLFNTTADKTVENITVTGLTLGTTYYFQARTVTNSHENNANTVYSEYTQEFPVTISEAVMSVTPLNLNLSETQDKTIITVKNTGTGTMNWKATEDSNWFSIHPDSGTNDGVITITYSANEGNTIRNGTITVTANGVKGSPQSVELKQDAPPYYENLTGDDEAMLDYFGQSVSISDKYAIVGATAQLNPNKSGSAYIFKYSDNAWIQQAKLTPSDSNPNDDFGISVSVSGNHAIVGSRLGSYIFKYNGDSWNEESKLYVSDGKFGTAVSIFGNYAVADGGYIFEYVNGNWTEQDILKTDEEQAYNGFGCSASIFGDYVIIGAEADSDYMKKAGSAYIFKRDGTAWPIHSKLTPNDINEGDAFGSSVSICGDYAIIGATQTAVYPHGNGCAYIFKRDDDTWIQQAKLTASDGHPSADFGCSVSIYSNYAVVGASNAGTVYVFKKPENGWSDMTETKKLSRDEARKFGISVSVHGNFAIIGDMENSENGVASGAAYIYGPLSDQDITIDTVSPVTTAVPDGGAYSSEQQVIITCSDIGGSGCASTHYTIDGNDPTTSSEEYSTPVPITGNTAIKFFSVDNIGNTEMTKTEEYIIDTDEPSVMIDSPQDGLQVTFPFDIKGTASDISGISKIEFQIKDEENCFLIINKGIKHFFPSETWIPIEYSGTYDIPWSFSFDAVYKYSFKSNTQYNLKVRATDMAGNSAETSIEFSTTEGVNPVTSIITCEIADMTGDPVDSIIIGESFQIKGIIDSLPEDSAGAFVEIILTLDDLEAIDRTAIANNKGIYSCKFDSEAINHSGKWIVRAKWRGAGDTEGAISEVRNLEVSKADSRVTLDVTSKAVKLGEKVSFSGKFTPEPDFDRNNSRIPITLIFTDPDGNESSEKIKTENKWGHFLLENTEFNMLGNWTIHAVFEGNDAYEPSISDSIQVRVVETAGYAVIVQGRLFNEEGLASHKKTADSVYTQLKNRGLLDNDIQYFSYGEDEKEFSKTDVKNAITDWAAGKMNEKPANLYIVMVDHGFNEVFYIDNADDESISSTELAEWTKELEDNLNDHSKDQEIIFALGFCRSGSFIDELSGDNRIIIASAAANESSFKGPLDDDYDENGNPIREGEYFISEFFKAVSFGKSLKQSFEEATAFTEIFTAFNSGEVNHEYNDEAYQHPLLDDNGDGIGSNELTVPGSDGLLSDEIFIGVSSITGNAPGDVMINHVTETKYIAEGDNSIDLWARVSNNRRLRTIWVEVKRPNHEPTGLGEKVQAEMDLYKKPTVNYHNLSNRYEWNDLDKFTDPGTYQVFYFAKDDLTGNVSSLMETKVYKAKPGNRHPDEFSLVSPEDGEKLSPTYYKDEDVYLMVLDWEDTTDPDGDNFSYTVILSKDYLFNDAIQIEGIKSSTSVIKLPVDWVNNNDIYWKVQAIDKYGAFGESDEKWVFHAMNDNPSVPVEGYVFNNSYHSTPIANALVEFGGGICYLTTDSNGFFSGTPNLPVDSTFRASACGYITSPDFPILDFKQNKKDFNLDIDSHFDIDGDFSIGLSDAISGLRVIVAMENYKQIDKTADINEDGKSGLEEVIYIIQCISGLRNKYYSTIRCRTNTP